MTFGVRVTSGIRIRVTSRNRIRVSLGVGLGYLWVSGHWFQGLHVHCSEMFHLIYAKFHLIYAKFHLIEACTDEACINHLRLAPMRLAPMRLASIISLEKGYIIDLKSSI